MACGSVLLLLACTFLPGITVLSQGAAGVGMGSGNLFGHAIITAGTLLSAVIVQCYGAASLTQKSLRGLASAKGSHSVGPETWEEQSYSEITQAILAVLMVPFLFLRNPIKARREEKECQGNLCIHRSFPAAGHCSEDGASLFLASSAVYRCCTWSGCKPQ